MGKETDELLECLVFLGEHYGKTVNPEGAKAGLPLDGPMLTPKLFPEAAKKAGFLAGVAKRKPSQIPSPLLPCILLLKDRKACVLFSRHKHKRKLWARVRFPGWEGTEEMLLSELDAASDGFVIYLKPEDSPSFHTVDEYAPQPKKHSRFWFWKTLARFHFAYAHVLLAAVFVNIFALTSSLYAMIIYDRVIPNQAVETLWTLAGGVLAVYFFDFLLKTVRGRLIDTAGKHADLLVASDLYNHLLGLQMDKKPASAGATASQLRSYETVREFFSSLTLVTLVDMPFFFLFAGMVFWIGGPWVALPSVAAGLGILLLSLVVYLPIRTAARTTQEGASRRHSLMIETIAGMETVKALRAEGILRRKMEALLAGGAASELRSKKWNSFAINATGLLTSAAQVSTVVLASFQVWKGEMTLGGMIAVSILTGRGLAPWSAASSLLSRLHQTVVALGELNAFKALPQERDITRQFLAKKQAEPSVIFEQVVHQYPGAPQPALRGVSCEIRAGERVAILGRNGVGKTTFQRLALGVYLPAEGRVLVGGMDTRHWDPADLRGIIGYVGQDPFLFSGSLRENILLGAPHSKPDAILEAVRFAGIDRWALAHPMGFDMPVGERGEMLSGGQRQSVVIARTLLSRPQILLLDEPTASLDSNSERELIECFYNYLRDGSKTMILTTHKPALLRLVERVLVMEQGVVVMDGPRDEILQKLQTAPGQPKNGGKGI